MGTAKPAKTVHAGVNFRYDAPQPDSLLGQIEAFVLAVEHAALRVRIAVFDEISLESHPTVISQPGAVARSSHIMRL